MTVVGPNPPQTDRIVRVQAHVSACLIVGGLLLARSAYLLIRPSDDVWLGAGVLTVVGATMALGLSVLPWVWPRLTVATQRVASWATLVVGTFAVSWATPVIDLGAIVGIQAILGGIVLAEVGGRRQALRWFWLSLLTLAIAVLAYWWAVPLRLTAE